MSHRAKSLAEVLQVTGAQSGDRIAVVSAGETRTYAQVDSDSSRLASSLQSAGFRRGARMVICLGNTYETVVAFWAGLKAGLVVSNVGADMPGASLNYIIVDSGAAVLVTTPGKMAELSQVSDEGRCLQTVILVGGAETDSNVASYAAVVAAGIGRPRDAGVIDVDLASIIYTSGSTGKPKGVMLTHRNMLTALDSLNAYLGYNRDDRVLCTLPLSFDYGLYQMLMCFSSGACLVLEKEFTSPLFLANKIREHDASIVPMVPPMVMLMYDYASRRNLQLPSVRMVTSTGAALKRPHISQIKTLFPEARIFSMYGLTECKRCTYLPPEDLDRKADSVGIAIPNTELWLVNEDGERIDAPNQVGELVIRGSTVMAGYWNDPQATAAKLRPGPYPGEMVLHTGDLCWLDADGYLYFHGRMDSVIKSRGMKVSPIEVEEFLYGIDGVISAVVVGVDSAAAGEALHAFVQVDSASGIDESSLLAICRQGLETHKIPESIELLDSLPRTSNGKFDIRSLRELARASSRGTLNDSPRPG